MNRNFDINNVRSSLHEKALQKEVQLNAIQYVGENFFRVGNADIPFSEKALEEMDRLIGIHAGQREIVATASGKTGLNKFRNYMNIASGIKEQKKVILVANTKQRTVERVIPLVEEYIPHDLFFNFIELIIDKGKYEIADIETSHDGTQMNVYLNSSNPVIKKIIPNEEFYSDGIYLNWNVATVEIGSYFTRLSCQNGATETFRHKHSRVHSLSNKNISSIMKIAWNPSILEKTFDRYSEKALLSMNSQASLREAIDCSDLLIQNGIPEDLCENLIGAGEERAMYSMRGYAHQPLNRLMSRHKVWDLYNILTKTATHDNEWLQSDGRRRIIFHEAAKLIHKSPDIINYINLYI